MEDKCEILAPEVEFYPKDGTILMMRCPECGRENWAPQVASGICSWCGFDGRELFEEEDTKK